MTVSEHNPPNATEVDATEVDSAEPTTSVARLVGIDFARFLAIVGMMCAHLLPHGSPLSFLWAGNASTLFAVVGGISVVLATRRYLERGAVAAARWAMAARGIIVILLGIALASIPQAIVVVLVYFGAAMLLSIPFLRLKTRWLLAAAAGLAIIAPFLNAGLRSDLGIVGEGGSVGWEVLADPLVAVRAIAITGSYPVVTWLVYVLIGMVLARLLISAASSTRQYRLIVRFAVAGAAMVVVSYAVTAVLVSTVVIPDFLARGIGLTGDDILALVYSDGFGSPLGGEWWNTLLNTPHTGSLFDLVRGIGAALLVLSITLLIAKVSSPVVLRLLRPISAAGAAPLTIYVMHVAVAGMLFGIVTAQFDSGEILELPWWVQGGGILALNVVGAVLIGLILALTDKRGPLETLVSYLSHKAAGLGRVGRESAKLDAETQSSAAELGSVAELRSAAERGSSTL